MWQRRGIERWPCRALYHLWAPSTGVRPRDRDWWALHFSLSECSVWTWSVGFSPWVRTLRPHFIAFIPKLICFSVLGKWGSSPHSPIPLPIGSWEMGASKNNRGGIIWCFFPDSFFIVLATVPKTSRVTGFREWLSQKGWWAAVRTQTYQYGGRIHALNHFVSDSSYQNHPLSLLLVLNHTVALACGSSLPSLAGSKVKLTWLFLTRGSHLENHDHLLCFVTCSW